MDTTGHADELAIATDTPSRWTKRTVQRLTDATQLGGNRSRPWLGATKDGNLDVADVESTVVTHLGVAKEGSDTEVQATERQATGLQATEAQADQQDGRSRPEPPAFDDWWMLVAPLVGAVVLSSVSLLVEPNPLRTGTSPSGLLAFGVLIPFFLLCVGGTLALTRDAARLSEAGTEWSPNPWHYVVPGAAALTAFHAYLAVRSAGRPDEIVGFLVGSLVVALVASSILAGPAYLLRRCRQFRET